MKDWGLAMINSKKRDYGIIVSCALRYALPRHTYITELVSSYIIENLEQITKLDLKIMIRDIEYELEHDTHIWNCDREVFENLLEKIKEKVNEPK